MAERRAKVPPTGRTLIVAFAAVAAVFTLSTAAEQVVSARIRAAAEEITGNSSPSVSLLSSMRGILRQLEVALADEVVVCEAQPCPEAPVVRQLRADLRQRWDEYRLLPTFPGEADRWPAAAVALSRVEEQVAATLAAPRGPRSREAARLLDDEVKPACDDLDAQLAAMSEFDRAQGLMVAARIDRLARFSITTAVVLDAASIVLTIVAAALAVRVVRRYERSLRERSDDLERFAGRVAHDVMSPLASTAGALQLAQRHASEAGRAALETGQRGLRRVQRLVEGLLEFARAGAPGAQHVATDVDDTLEDVLAELGPMAEERLIALQRPHPCSGAVACTPGVLTSVVSNLVRNAISYMGSSPVRNVRVDAALVDEGRMVRFEVEDSGPGIPAELGDRIFEPFVRGAQEAQPGTGLGLATAKRFVDAHGGRIGYASQPGQGTRFWFELPAAGGGPPGRA